MEEVVVQVLMVENIKGDIDDDQADQTTDETEEKQVFVVSLEEASSVSNVPIEDETILSDENVFITSETDEELESEQAFLQQEEKISPDDQVVTFPEDHPYAKSGDECISEITLSIVLDEDEHEEEEGLLKPCGPPKKKKQPIHIAGAIRSTDHN